MTFREKLRADHPYRVNPDAGGGCERCPASYGYENEVDAPCNESLTGPTDEMCNACWDREMPDGLSREEYGVIGKSFGEGYLEGIQRTIKDSGERTEFSTGAVRDMHAGKGDMASIPWEAVLRLSRHYENGADKYERWNFRKGIPVSSFIDSACRHLAKYQCGQDDEDHLAAAAFNVLGAMLMENTLPEMQDLPLRKGKKTFDYFEVSE